MNNDSFARFVDLKINHAFILTVILCIAAGLRMLLIFDDFWLDEIWSLNLAKNVNNFSAIFTDLTFDANHILNTAYLYLVRDADSWVIYRAVSFICGLISIILIYKISLIFGKRQAVIAAILSAVCFPLVLYSTEARGYSMSIMFSLLSFICLYHFLINKKTWSIGAFWICALLAMLAHFSYSYFYAAIFQWSLYVLWKSEIGLKKVVKNLLFLHLIPMAIFIYIYFKFVLKMGVAGANISYWPEELLKFSSLMYGLPQNSVIGGLLLLLSVFMVLLVAYYQYKNNSIYWPLFPLVILINPLIIILFADVRFPQMRYFLLLLPFIIISFSIFINMAICQYRSIKFIYTVFVFVFVTANIGYAVLFSNHGRGEYSKAIQYLVSQTSNTKNTLVVSSDHDFRNYALLDFYNKYLKTGVTIHYVTQEVLSQYPPEWYFVHDFSVQPDPTSELLLLGKYHYKLEVSFLAFNPKIIGWHWYIYKRA